MAFESRAGMVRLPPVEVGDRVAIQASGRFTLPEHPTVTVSEFDGQRELSVPVLIEHRVERPELLDNPNDPRGRTNVEIAADALMAKCDGEVVRYDDEGTCEWLWDGEPVRGRRHCMCLTDAKTMVAALEATGRLQR